jgi:signal peptidase
MHTATPSQSVPEKPSAPAKHLREKSVWHYLKRGLSWGLLALVIGLGILVVGIPAATGSTPLTVLTSSMEPTLPPGTLVVVRPTPAQDIRLGDVLTYQIKPGNPAVVSHRVIEVHSISNGTKEFVTQGDNNPAADAAPVTEGQIKGTIWYSVPFVGWASIVVGHYSGWLVPIAAVGLLGYAAVMIVSAALGRARNGRRATAEEKVLPLAD